MAGFGLTARPMIEGRRRYVPPSICLREQHLRVSFLTREDVLALGARLFEGDAAHRRLRLVLDPRLVGPVRLEEAADEAALVFDDLLQLIVGFGVARVGLAVGAGLVVHRG